MSVPSNIAEGAARATRKEFLHFLAVARGSLSELDTQVRIARDLEFLQEGSGLSQQIDKVFGALGALIKITDGFVMIAPAIDPPTQRRDEPHASQSRAARRPHSERSERPHLP